MTGDAVLRAWHAWDAKPGAANTTEAMEAACARLAANLGMTTTAFRARLEASRQAGLSREQAVASAIATAVDSSR